MNVSNSQQNIKMPIWFQVGHFAVIAFLGSASVDKLDKNCFYTTHFAISIKFHYIFRLLLTFPCIFAQHVYVNLSACCEGRSTIRTFACSFFSICSVPCYSILWNIFPSQSCMLHICQKHTSRITLHKLLLEVCIDIFVFVETFVNDALDIACNHISWKRTVYSPYIYTSLQTSWASMLSLDQSIGIGKAHLHTTFYNFAFQSTKKKRIVNTNNSMSIAIHTAQPE